MFAYAVGTSGSTVSGLEITQINLPNGATIKDGSGAAANLSNALSTSLDVTIDPLAAPTLLSLVSSRHRNHGWVKGDLCGWHVVTLTLNLSEAVAVGGHADADPQQRRHRDLLPAAQAACADLQLHGGGAARTQPT